MSVEFHVIISVVFLGVIEAVCICIGNISFGIVDGLMSMIIFRVLA